MKKRFLKIGLLTVCAQAYNFEEFKAGIHTGMFMENEEDLDDYSCSEIGQASKSHQDWKAAIENTKHIIKILKVTDPRTFTIIDSIQGIVQISYIFDEEYDGGEFCQGLLFSREAAKIFFAFASLSEGLSQG